MKRVATAVVLIPLVLLAVFRAPQWLFMALVGVVALLAIHEYLGIVEHYGIRPFRKATYGLLVLGYATICYVVSLAGPMPMGYVRHYYYAVTNLTNTVLLLLGVGTVLLPIVFLVLGMFGDELRAALPAAAASSFGFLYIFIPLALTVSFKGPGAGPYLLFYLLLIVWAGDIFAYYFGRAFGKHAMAPRVSPKKTWEGAAASFLGAIVVGELVFTYNREITSFLSRLHMTAPGYEVTWPITTTPLWVVLVLSILINIAAQLSDLAESLLKRGAGVKDSGSLLPGHGGILDRIDALLFAIPVLWYYAGTRLP